MTEPATGAPVIHQLAAQRDRWLAFLRPRVNNAAAAEDILQESLLKAFRKGGEIQEEERSSAWFYRVLRNTLIDYFRRQGARPDMCAGELELLSAIAPEEHGEPTTCQCFHNRLDYLNPRYAQLIRLVDLERCGIDEAAALLGDRPQTIHVALHRARKALRRELESYCGDCANGACLKCTCGEYPRKRS